MDLANPKRAGVRVAGPEDAAALGRLLQRTVRLHLHADWHRPKDWLGEPTFMAWERADGRWLACLAVVADPPPAAWVRVAAVEDSAESASVLTHLWHAIQEELRRQNVSQVAWLVTHPWLNARAPELGFRLTNAIETYFKPDLELPSLPAPTCHIRAVTDADLPALVALEEAAFDPLWRHSLDGLRRGRRESITFDLAEIAGRPVGFQYGVVTGEDEAHLVRLTVDPAMQGRGVGSALLAHTLQGYRQLGLRCVALNTQVDNVQSQRLYLRFGFEATGQRFPVWTCRL